MRSTIECPIKTRTLLALRPKYQNASWTEKKQLLDGFVAAGQRVPPKVCCDSPFCQRSPERARQAKPQKDLQSSGGRCTVDYLERSELHLFQTAHSIPFFASLIDSLERFGHLVISDTVRTQLLALSPATADRLLRSERRKHGKGKCTTKTGKLIRKHVPIRTFADWNDVVPDL